MKLIKYLVWSFLALGMMVSCSDDDEKGPGDPVLELKSQFSAGFFGDSIPFAVNVSDNHNVPLSTVKLKLYFGEEMVSEKVIRTKTEGDYSGKIYVPYFVDIPNGTAKLEVVLQNVNMTIESQTIDLPLSRPDFPYLTLVSGNDQIRMERVGLYQYEAVSDFPAKVPGYIKAPAYGANGNEISFGWENDAIKEHSENNIPFSNIPGNYTIHFNTFNYDATPFIVAYAINGTVLSRIDDEHFSIDAEFAQGETIEVEGIDNFSEWWIDPDYFTSENGGLKFAPISGKYRITADFENQYLQVEAMIGNNLASLQPDGTGAIWIIGDGAGKPTLANSAGWNPAKAICLAPMDGKKYQATFVAGSTINANDINFKFFHQKNWGGEYQNTTLSTTSDIILVGDGTNGRDPGNLGVVAGKSLEAGASYLFVVDVSGGIDQAVLTVTKK